MANFAVLDSWEWIAMSSLIDHESESWWCRSHPWPVVFIYLFLIFWPNSKESDPFSLHQTIDCNAVSTWSHLNYEQLVWFSVITGCVCVCVQVKTRFCKFLKSMFQRMLTDHCLSPYPSSSPEFPESSLPTVAGLTNDGVENLRAHALVVSHGAFIRVAVRHLVDGLHCSLPEGLKMSQVYSACPNTGICRFVITLQMEQDVPRPIALHCIFINRKDHLISLKD